MSEEKKCIKSEELCAEKKELSLEELEQVSGGSRKNPSELIGTLIGASTVVLKAELMGR